MTESGIASWSTRLHRISHAPFYAGNLTKPTHAAGSGCTLNSPDWSMKKIMIGCAIFRLGIPSDHDSVNNYYEKSVPLLAACATEFILKTVEGNE